MATRLYFSRTAPSVTPAFDASWEVTTSAVRRVLEDGKANSPSEAFETIIGTTNSNTPAGAVDRLLAQYVSAPLNGNQTIAGNISGQALVFETAAAADMDTQMVIWVMKTDGTSRGTLIASDTTALAHEWNTALRNISLPKGGSTAPSSVAAQDTDRIVVEIGYRKHESATTNRDGRFQGGAPSGTDLPVDETDTTATKVGWIEFADTLTFYTSTARLTNLSTETIRQPTTPAARLTLLSTETVRQPPDTAARLTMLSVEVVRPRRNGFFTADAFLYNGYFSGSFTVDAVLRKAASGSLAADAIKLRTQGSSILADADIKGTRSGSFIADAYLFSASQGAGDFTADAILRKSSSGSLTADAVRLKAQTASLTGDAVLKKTLSPTFSANAVKLKNSGTRTFTADAYKANTVSGSFSANAILKRTQSGFSFSANAYLIRTGGSFTADADLLRGTRHFSSFSADAFFAGRFTANAIIFRQKTKTFTADAVIGQGFGSFRADAWLKKSQSASFTANAIIGQHYSSFSADAILYLGSTGAEDGSGGTGGGTGGAGGIGAGYLPAQVIHITVGGTDITGHVTLETAEFISMTNGNVGSCMLRVKDVGHTYTFTTGDEIVLTIGGRRAWGGFLIRATKSYPFPVEVTTTAATSPRYWLLSGAEYNLLFDRRIVYSSSAPKHRVWSYPSGTYDNTIINDMLDNYLPDVTGDGLGRDIDRVDVAILNIKNFTKGGLIADPGDTWRQMMDQVARATGAVYYIDPDKVIQYHDVDTADNPYILTDTPTTHLDVGFQKFSLTENGAELINDYLLWGAALGVDHMVFSHVQDATSIADHNRWQGGNMVSIYHQNLLDLSANSVVYGTPQNKRGHKDDAISFSCTVFLPVFRAGQKVQVYSNIYGWNDVIPIRRMRITFANPRQAIYELDLSHAIDEPWSTFESQFPPIIHPTVPIPPIPKVCPDPPCGQTGGGCDCGITDTFTRTVADGWGTSDAGPVWTAQPGDGLLSVDGSKGIITFDTTHDTAQPQLVVSPIPEPVSILFRGAQENLYSSDNGWSFVLGDGDTNQNDSGFNYAGIQLDFDGELWLYTNVGNGGHYQSVVQTHPGGAQLSGGSAAFTVSHFFFVRWLITRNGDGTITSSARTWWDGDAEPTGYQVSYTSTSSAMGTMTHLTGEFFSLFGDASATYIVDSIDITGVDRCSGSKFDNFNRVVADGSLGTSDSGATWSATFTGDSSVLIYEVDGSNAHLRLGSGNWSTISSSAITEAVTDGIFEMTSSFRWTDLFAYIIPYGLRQELRFLFADDVNNSWTNSIGTFGAVLGAVMSWRDTAQTVRLTSAYGDDVTPATLADASFSWAADTQYDVRLSMNLTTMGLKLRVWEHSSSEPTAWTLETTVTQGPPSALTTFLMQVDGRYTYSSAIQDYYVDYIDFDYAGKPCYQDCPETTFDDFNRTVAAGGWGTASSGAPWTVLGGGSDFSANGSIGLLTWGSGAPTVEVDSGPFAGDTWTMTCRFVTGTVTAGGRSIKYELFGPDMNRSAWTFIDPTSGNLELDTAGSVGFNFTSATAYLLKFSWNRLTGMAGAKVWADGMTEPSADMLTADWGAGNASLTAFRISGHFASDTYTHSFDYINFTTCSPVAQTSGSAPSGYVCENPTTTDYQTYHTASAYVAGSTEVWVNGLRISRSTRTTDYMETTSLGTITFGSPVNPADVVRVCYQANGAV